MRAAATTYLAERQWRGCGLGVAQLRNHFYYLALCFFRAFGCLDARTEKTLHSVRARGYQTNPGSNQSRVEVRVRDEEVPKALSGMRPKASISASVGPQLSNVKIPTGRALTGQRQFSYDEYLGYPSGATFSATQTLFDGGRLPGGVRHLRLAAPDRTGDPPERGHRIYERTA